MSPSLYFFLVVFVLFFNVFVDADDSDKGLAIGYDSISLDNEVQNKKNRLNAQQKCIKNTQAVQNLSVCAAGNVIYDKQTGLMWTRCALGKTWNNNEKKCLGNASIYSWKES
ncbi:MAG: hypothetical protein QM479_04270, partial [Pseudomonadota bacterium]